MTVLVHLSEDRRGGSKEGELESLEAFVAFYRNRFYAILQNLR
jgi:hypothetical protein